MPYSTKYIIPWQSAHGDSVKNWQLEITPPYTGVGITTTLTVTEPILLSKASIAAAWDKRPISSSKSPEMKLTFDLQAMEVSSDLRDLRSYLLTGPFAPDAIPTPVFTLRCDDGAGGPLKVKYQGAQRVRPGLEVEIDGARTSDAVVTLEIETVDVVRYMLDHILAKDYKLLMSLQGYTRHSYRPTVVWDEFYTDTAGVHGRCSGSMDGKTLVREMFNLAGLFDTFHANAELYYKLLVQDSAATLTFDSIDPTSGYNSVGTPYDHIQFYKRNYLKSNNWLSAHAGDTPPRNALYTRDLWFTGQVGNWDGTTFTPIAGLFVDGGENSISFFRDHVSNAWDLIAACSESACRMSISYDSPIDAVLRFRPIRQGNVSKITLDIMELEGTKIRLSANVGSITDAKAQVNGLAGDDMSEYTAHRQGIAKEDESSTNITFHNLPNVAETKDDVILFQYGSRTVRLTSIPYGAPWKDYMQLSSSSIYFVGLTTQISMWQLAYFESSLPANMWDPTPGTTPRNTWAFVRPHSRVQMVGDAPYGQYPVPALPVMPTSLTTTQYNNLGHFVDEWWALLRGYMIVDQQKGCLPYAVVESTLKWFCKTHMIEVEADGQYVRSSDLGELFKIDGGAHTTMSDFISDSTTYLTASLDDLMLVDYEETADTGVAKLKFLKALGT